MNIHPTAIVSPQAELDESVIVGPYTLIEAQVRIGPDNEIGSSVRIYQGTRLGRGNRIDHGAVLGCAPQDYSFDPSCLTRLEVGDHNTFREGANIHRANNPEKATRIGDHNYFMGTFHVGHDCEVGCHNTLGHGTVLAGHVTIGDHIFISGVAAIHQFCNIGDYAMIAGCAKIVKDVPPYSTADGNPARIIGLNSIALRRAGLLAQTRSAIKQAYKRIFHGHIPLSQCIRQMSMESNGPEVEKIIGFFQASARGVTGHR